jgi:hypothetical protein
MSERRERRKRKEKRNTHVIPIVQNVKSTICTVSVPPRIEARPTKEAAIAGVSFPAML